MTFFGKITITPTSPDDRIEVIDSLRGFAILGILIVNMQVFSGSGWEKDIFTGKLDQLIYWIIEVFASGKFLNLFSFLFGVGFAIQLGKAIRKKSNFRTVYIRRLLVLFFFGIIHGIFIARVDNLTTFAILGCLLLLIPSFSNKAIKLLFIICLLTPFVYNLSDGPNIWNQENKEHVVQNELKAKSELCHSCDRELHKDGTYNELVLMRVDYWSHILTSVAWYKSIIGYEFVVFLIGFYISRKGFFRNLQKHIVQIKRALPWIFIIGLTITLVSLYSENLLYNLSDIIKDPIAELLFLLGAIAMSASYLFVIIILNSSGLWKKCLTWLAKVGRMSLTNYLLQSIICSFIFYEHGLGLYGKLGPTIGILLTLLIFILQIIFSNWWFKWARFGPFEWIWRSITYGRLQPILN